MLRRINTCVAAVVHTLAALVPECLMVREATLRRLDGCVVDRLNA